MALYSSSTNFVSAETNCYTIGEHFVCIFTNADPPAKALVFCDKDGKNCTVTWASKENPVTPEVKNAIKNAQTAAQTANLSPESQTTNSPDMKSNSPTPPQCPNTGPIPPDCTMKPPLK